MFPANWPDFTTDQRRRLKQLGVCDEQITKLRYALIIVHQHVRPPAANNEVASHLAEIERLASKLSRKLRAAVVPEAAFMIETRYWQRRPTDDGPTMALHLCPRLDTLTAAAVAAADALPKGKQARSNASNPRPIQCIDEALLTGWIKRHGPVAGSWIGHDDDDAVIAAMVEAAKANPPGKPFPVHLRASVSEGSAFREIVGICYSAVGYSRFPKRALEAYVKACNRDRRELIAGLDEALSKQE